MKKTKIIILCLVAAVVVLVAGSSLLLGGNAQIIRYERHISLIDGVVDPAVTEMIFTIEEDKQYQFGLKWEPSQSGILSGIHIVNAQNETVFACTGEEADIESMTMFLTAGEYTLENHYLTSEEAFENFCAVAELTPSFIKQDEYEYALQGQWDIKYEFKIIDASNHTMAYATIIGVLVGLLLVVVILAVTKTDDSLKSNFDERQEMVRGKGFKYGFFTVLIFNGVFCILNLFEVSWFAELEVAMFLSAIMGIIVFACYCILKDGYFSLNENRKKLLVCFAGIGIFNMVLGIANFLQGYGFANGRFTYRSINLFVGIMSLIVFGTILCKQMKDGKED